MACLAEKAGLVQEVLDTIAHSLPGAEEQRAWWMMCAVLAELAKRGHHRAFDILVKEAGNDNESAINRLADVGIEGLRWLVSNRLLTLSVEDLWELEGWVDDATGKDELEGLDDLDDDLRQTIEQALARKPARTEAPKEAKPDTMPLAEAIDRAIRGESIYRSAISARQASEEELIAAAERLVRTIDDREAAACANAFRKRPFPLDPKLLIARVDDPEVGNTIIRLLGRIDTEEVHDFALTFARRRPVKDNSLEPLRKSYRATDEEVISAVLRDCLELDRYDLHSIVLDLLQVGERATPEVQERWMRWVYENSPCSFCRSSAVRDLIELNVFPAEWLEEATFDASEDVRKAVSEYLAPKDGTELLESDSAVLPF